MIGHSTSILFLIMKLYFKVIGMHEALNYPFIFISTNALIYTNLPMEPK